jgi:carbon monoxide dehydrogenase subunit G
MIQINETVELPATAEEVWAVLSDPYEVVSCIADAEITNQNADGTYDGKMTVKFGPMRVNFLARVALQLDEGARQGSITAQGRDSQGGTRMKTTANFDMTPGSLPDTTIVNMKGEVDLSGRLATQIEGAAGVVVKRMSTEFSEALSRRLSPEPEVTAPIPSWWRRVVSGVVSWFRRLSGQRTK